MKENVVSLKTQPEAAPGKVIPASASALRKLADSLAAVMTALAAAEREQRDAEGILAEVPPVPFDHAAAGRAVAEARVADLMSGSATADAVQQRMDRDRAEAAAAADAFAKRQAGAQAQAESAGPMIAALRGQAVELDRALRSGLAQLGQNMEAAAAQAMADAIGAYLDAFVEYKAVRALQQAEVVGNAGRQFVALNESDLSVSCPNEIMDRLPAGWMSAGTRNLLRHDRFDLAGVIGERRRALMEDATNGAYPAAAALLHRADQVEGEA